MKIVDKKDKRVDYPQPTFNELTSNSVDQPGFGIDANTSFEPPQASLDTYNTATQDLGYVERFNIFDSDTKAKADANRQMKAEEETRAKAAKEFARTEAIRAANELAAAEKQLADLQVAAENAAKTKEIQAAIEAQAAQSDGSPTGGSTNYSAPSTPTGGSTGYSGNYNEPGRGGSPEGNSSGSGSGGGSRGGGGGYASFVTTQSIGSTVTIIVGAGGTAAGGVSAAVGGAGRVILTWS